MDRQIPERYKFAVDDLIKSDDFYKSLCKSIDKDIIPKGTDEIEVIISGLRNLCESNGVERYNIPDFYLNREYQKGIKIHVFSDFRPKIYKSDFERNNYDHIREILNMYHDNDFMDIKIYSQFEIRSYNGKICKFDEKRAHFYSYHGFRVYWKFGCLPVTEEEKSHYDKY